MGMVWRDADPTVSCQRRPGQSKRSFVDHGMEHGIQDMVVAFQVHVIMRARMTWQSLYVLGVIQNP